MQSQDNRECENHDAADPIDTIPLPFLFIFSITQREQEEYIYGKSGEKNRSASHVDRMADGNRQIKDSHGLGSLGHTAREEDNPHTAQRLNKRHHPVPPIITRITQEKDRSRKQQPNHANFGGGVVGGADAHIPT